MRIEDHALKLRILQGILDPASLQGVEDSKQLVSREDALKEILEAHRSHVEEAYNHIACLLTILQQA